MNSWAHSFDAQSPHDPNMTLRVGVAKRKLKAMQAAGHMAKLARYLLVQGAMTKPTMIVKGWSRLDRDGCFVYVAKPSIDYRGNDIEVPPPPGMHFLVFVLPDGKIDDWAWRPASKETEGMPDGVTGEVIWPKQT
jgi:hypothetical protein